ncbi:MAG: DeoR/GlpR transcriptional regulator [Roseiflexaceae bacterium]|nr:DeoR/GlpR transcriptional regulator [Roseiflexaceae bacterium]
MSDVQRLTSAEDRREVIMRLLNDSDRTSVVELSQKLNVSEVTVRKDLDYLEAQGVLTRVHGGAVFSGLGRFELHFAERQQIKLQEKRRIAQAAANLIQDDMSLFLDASTTAFQIARLIKDRKQLTVVTNGLYNALELTFCPDITVMVAGGLMRSRSSSLVGGLTQDLARLRVDIGFFGARGISAKDGMTETDLNESTLKRQMVEAARTVVGVIDSSKFGQVHLSAFALPHEIDRVITDQGTPESMIEALRAAQIVVDVV